MDWSNAARSRPTGPAPMMWTRPPEGHVSKVVDLLVILLLVQVRRVLRTISYKRWL